MNKTKTLSIILLSIVTILWAGPGTEAGTTTAKLSDIRVDDALDLVEERSGDSDFVILDVRTPEEFAAGHVEGAVNIDFYRSDFRDLLSELDRDVTYLVYCRSGNRSGRTMPILGELGFAEAFNLLGGFNEAGGVLPTVR